MANDNALFTDYSSGIGLSQTFSNEFHLQVMSIRFNIHIQNKLL